MLSLNSEKIDMSDAREAYLSWDEYFMSTAFLSAMRSKDPVTQVGAVIVNSQKRIVGIGYNGMPRGRYVMYVCTMYIDFKISNMCVMDIDGALFHIYAIAGSSAKTITVTFL